METETYYTETVSFNRFRPLAIILEWVPIMLCILAVILDNGSLKTLSFVSLALIYPIFAWYLFKAKEFRWYDIIVATFFGFGLSIALMGFVFFFQNWEGIKAMVTIADLTISFCFVLSIIWLIIKNRKEENRPYEFRMSQKIFLRFLLCLIIIYAFQMNQPLDALFNK